MLFFFKKKLLYMYEYTLTQWILLYRPSVYHVRGISYHYHIIVSDISLKRDALGYINFMSQKV